jgi:hypothetical protein
LETINLNQNRPWNLNRKFNLIIHWGLLYHLENWKDDLKHCLAHTNLICLESEIADSSEDTHDEKITEAGYDKAFEGIGSRPSAYHVQKH